MGTFRSYVDESRQKWGRTDGQNPTTEQLGLGCLQRIASALESIDDRLRWLDPDERRIMAEKRKKARTWREDWESLASERDLVSRLVSEFRGPAGLRRPRGVIPHKVASAFVCVFGKDADPASAKQWSALADLGAECPTHLQWLIDRKKGVRTPRSLMMGAGCSRSLAEYAQRVSQSGWPLTASEKESP
jgi:hypothetical protein